MLIGMLKLLMPSSLMLFEEVNTFQTFELNLYYQKSEMYSLPQTSLNWKIRMVLAFLLTLMGVAVLLIFGRKSNV